MKKAILIVMAVFLMAGTAFAQGASGGTMFDVSLGMGTEPDSNLGMGYGLRIGVSKEFGKLFPAVKKSNFTKNLYMRGDLGYFAWEDSKSVTAFGITSKTELTYSRIPIFLGGRHVWEKLGGGGITAYAEAGLEFSFDKAEVTAKVTGLPTVSDDESEINFGISPGFGVLYPMSEKTAIGLAGRLHLIADSYSTWMFTVVYKL
jgi:hypothetical protein